MNTSKKSSTKSIVVKSVSLISAFILLTASSCIIKDDKGGEAIHIDAPRIACDAQCGCATDGEATRWAACMASK